MLWPGGGRWGRSGAGGLGQLMKLLRNMLRISIGKLWWTLGMIRLWSISNWWRKKFNRENSKLRRSLSGRLSGVGHDDDDFVCLVGFYGFLVMLGSEMDYSKYRRYISSNNFVNFFFIICLQFENSLSIHLVLFCNESDFFTFSFWKNPLFVCIKGWLSPSCLFIPWRRIYD